MRQPERARRRRQPAARSATPARPRRRSASSRSRRASASRSCAATRCRSRPTASSGPTARGRTARWAQPRQHPTLGRVNEAARERPTASCELRNPAVMMGYWGMPEETERVLAPAAGCRPATSCAENDDGTYTFVGRKKEVIRRRGENVAPAEVEEALASHPDVVEAAVVGVPSEPQRGGRQGVRRHARRRRRRSRRAARLGGRAAHPASRCRATTRRSTSCPTRHRPGREARADPRAHRATEAATSTA